MKMLAALALWSPWLSAQAVSVGLRAGIPINGMLTGSAGQQAAVKRYTIGPVVEVRLWRGTAVGADFLFEGSQLAMPPAGLARPEVWRWEAPVTLKYRFRAPGQPFARAGVSFNRVFDVGGAAVCGRGPFGEEFYCAGGSRLAELRHRGTSGVVAGGGVQFKLGKLRLEPEVRWTHWIDRNFGVRDAAIRSNLNQISLLVGVIL